jgi:pimeloyl-ACP methyl ester carboxylesterase
MTPAHADPLDYHDTVVNGVTLRYVDRGEGPLVLLLHGFPESAYAWRHQIAPLAESGYRVVAPDLRGYGGSSVPSDASAYTYFHIIGDLVALMDRLGYAKATVVGHDMGSYVAWHMALVLPARVQAVAGLSVALPRRPPEPPLSLLERTLGPDFYQLRFQVPLEPEEDMEGDIPGFLRAIFVGLSADTEQPVRSLMVPPGRGFSDLFPAPSELPPWLTEEDVQRYAAMFASTGFTGAVNWYRNIDRNWELMAPWDSARVTAPAIYVAGELDIAYEIARSSGALASMSEVVADLRDTVVIPACGHWLGEEQPSRLNEVLLNFLRDI